jgi:TPR repeat protein
MKFLFLVIGIVAPLFVTCNLAFSQASTVPSKSHTVEIESIDTQEIFGLIEEAEKGNVDAQHKLGDKYFDGDGVLQNYLEAKKWYELAAKQGDSDSQYRIGVFYANGFGVVKDIKVALKWLRMSADQDDYNAQYELGYRYFFGTEVAVDYVEAEKLIRKSAEHKYPPAQAMSFPRKIVFQR